MKKSLCIGAAIMFAVAILSPATLLAAAPEAFDDVDVINVKDYGAKGDGVTDDTDALQRAIDEAFKRVLASKESELDKWGHYAFKPEAVEAFAGYSPVVVYIPRGTYLVNRTIKIHPFGYRWLMAIRVTGEFARIKAGSEMESVLDVHIAGYITIEGLTIDAAGLAQHGFKAFKISTRNALVENVNVTGALSHGFVLDKCQGAIFRRCSSSSNGDDGWMIMNCNAAIFTECSGNSNQGNGYTVTAPDFSGGCIISELWSEGNKGHGILVEESVSSQVVLKDGWIEGNGKDAVRVESVSARLTGLNILGSFRDDSRHGTPRQPSEYASIRLTKTAAGCYVSGNQIRGGGLRGGRIRVEGDPELHYVTGNFRIWRSRSVEPVGIYVMEETEDDKAAEQDEKPALIQDGIEVPRPANP